MFKKIYRHQLESSQKMEDITLKLQHFNILVENMQLDIDKGVKESLYTIEKNTQIPLNASSVNNNLDCSQKLQDQEIVNEKLEHYVSNEEFIDLKMIVLATNEKFKEIENQIIVN